MREAGLIAQGSPLPFTGALHFVAGSRPDSVYTLVSLSFAASALTFRRDGDQHRADYRVTITHRRNAPLVDATETVRVATLRETARTDESVVFQQMLTLPPGRDTLSVSVRDEYSGKAATSTISVNVPALADGSLTPPIAYYEVSPRTSRDSVLRIVSNPHAMALYGRDTTVDVYLEAYGPPPQSVTLALQIDHVTVWSASVGPHDRGNGLSTLAAKVPVAPIGLGSARIVATRDGSPDTVSTPVFVALSEDIPATSFDDMVSHLKYFVPDAKLRELADVAPAARGTTWARFYKETDATPATPDNEALRRYLTLMRDANARFSDSGIPGWKTDRGMVWLMLGPYDQAIEPVPNDPTQRGRVLVWEYRSAGISVEFVRAAGNDPWRLTQASEADVRNAVRRMGGGSH